ncbi:unnamed protein product [Phytomonas sp. EM1]|nr:unnamed protein product [Phytomonas sp. EM1]|eukprot:CCW62668.1 unnamed protein product [Phytomonas sp. isolate EM1]
MRALRQLLATKDFDAWSYSIFWPQMREELPLLDIVNSTVEDIKFAYNAWSLLRLNMFFGMRHPTVLSGLVNTRPSMDITCRGNRIFYEHATVNGSLSSNRIKVALTLPGPKAQPIQLFPWEEVISKSIASIENRGIELVLGMENGMSEAVSSRCNYHVFIPQYGSIGSLSMLSALSIAIHTAHTAYYCLQKSTNDAGLLKNTTIGCTSGSNNLYRVAKTLPQESNTVKSSVEQTRAVLKERRKSYALQIAIIMHNDLGDRNIGAVIRNANVFNCEQMIILNRRRFNKRGAIGTQHVLDLNYYKDINDPALEYILRVYVVWLLYPYYPYLQIYSNLHPNGFNSGPFIQHGNDELKSWQSTKHHLTREHPLIQWFPHLLNSELYLDDENTLLLAIEETKRKGYKGILLAVPEEGTSPHPQLAHISSRTLFITHPNYLNLNVQRGLNAALATSIALERIRFCITHLS